VDVGVVGVGDAKKKKDNLHCNIKQTLPLKTSIGKKRDKVRGTPAGRGETHI